MEVGDRCRKAGEQFDYLMLNYLLNVQQIVNFKRQFYTRIEK